MPLPAPQPEHKIQTPPPEQRFDQFAQTENVSREAKPNFVRPTEMPTPAEQPTTPAETDAAERPVEFAPTLETAHTSLEKSEGFLDETIAKLRSVLKSKKKKNLTLPQVKDEATVQIERIMEEGLNDAYQELTLIQRQEFKIKGEATAWQIRNLLKQAHVKIKKIFQLLVEWLRLLPGINRYFLEQEAKIKADKIIGLKARGTLGKK